VIADDADIDFFRKITRAHHCAHSLLPPVKAGAHNLRPKGHTYVLPRCMCNFSHCICVFIFLFQFHCILCHTLYQLSACTSVTCTLKDQSINQVAKYPLPYCSVFAPATLLYAVT